MTTISKLSQLSTFSMIRTLILTNTTLNKKFTIKDIYEFEPKHKSTSFNGFPYIIVQVPGLDDLNSYLGDTLRQKEFEIQIIMRMDYEARDNLSSYASQLVSTLDGGNSAFNSSGYNLMEVSVEGQPELVTIQSKEIVEIRFSLMLEGEVAV